MGLLPWLKFVKTLVLFITWWWSWDLIISGSHIYNFCDCTTITSTIITIIIIKMVMIDHLNLIPRQPHLQLPSMQGVEQGRVRLHRCRCNLSWRLHNGCRWSKMLHSEVKMMIISVLEQQWWTSVLFNFVASDCNCDVCYISFAGKDNPAGLTPILDVRMKEIPVSQ